ncbi:unnamed protein product, partial [marine sediment metagenome]
MKKIIVAVDLGAGFGVKLGLFYDPQSMLSSDLLPLADIEN